MTRGCSRVQYQIKVFSSCGWSYYIYPHKFKSEKAAKMVANEIYVKNHVHCEVFSPNKITSNKIRKTESEPAKNNVFVKGVNGVLLVFKNFNQAEKMLELGRKTLSSAGYEGRPTYRGAIIGTTCKRCTDISKITEEIKAGMFGKSEKGTVPVRATFKDGSVRFYDSIAQAAKCNNMAHNSVWQAVSKGKKAKGIKFEKLEC